jgi:hypothetical protein
MTSRITLVVALSSALAVAACDSSTPGGTTGNDGKGATLGAGGAGGAGGHAAGDAGTLGAGGKDISSGAGW